MPPIGAATQLRARKGGGAMVMDEEDTGTEDTGTEVEGMATVGVDTDMAGVGTATVGVDTAMAAVMGTAKRNKASSMRNLFASKYIV